MIRIAPAARGRALGIDVFMECTVTELLSDGSGSIAGAFAYWRETGRFGYSEAPRRWCWRPAASGSRSR